MSQFGSATAEARRQQLLAAMNTPAIRRKTKIAARTIPPEPADECDLDALEILVLFEFLSNMDKVDERKSGDISVGGRDPVAASVLQRDL